MLLELSLALFVSVAAWADTAQAPRDPGPGFCPETREFVAPLLQTRPEDGLLYEQQRAAIRMPIAQILEFMGGIERAFAIAEATRADAERRIAAGALGAELRYHQDTVLRADALIEILLCLTETESTGLSTPQGLPSTRQPA
ncbi:MAG: hypothetical protein QNJ67_10480 [Kiloniellales bacterium]|nr:hypothetical protein [Kiloniellales bacterium]